MRTTTGSVPSPAERGSPHHPARLPRRPIGARLSAGHLLTLITGIVAAVLTYAALRGGGALEVAVAARPLAAGAPLTSDAFRFQTMRLPAEAAQSLLTRRDAAAYERGAMVVSVPEGGIVARSMVASEIDARLRDVPVVVDSVPAGLAPGDRVDVALPARPGDDTTTVVYDVEVVHLAGGLNGLATVTLRTDRQKAEILMNGGRNGRSGISRVEDAAAATGMAG